jgi:hypothetical protein
MRAAQHDVSRLVRMSHGLWICGALAVAGCASVDYRQQFETPKNAAIGQVIERTWYSQPSWITDRSDHLEFGFNGYAGCSWLFEVDRETHVIRGWRYLSEPTRCWRHVPQAW